MTRLEYRLYDEKAGYPGRLGADRRRFSSDGLLFVRAADSFSRRAGDSKGNIAVGQFAAGLSIASGLLMASLISY